MRKPFTKAMVQTIEEKFKIKLTEEQIAKGYIKLDYEKGFGITTIEVEVGRAYSNNKMVGVTAKFKGDNIFYLNGHVENAKLKKMLNRI